MTPPRPRLFRAIAILGVILGSFGVVKASGGLSQLSRNEHVPIDALGSEAQVEAERQVMERLDRLDDRYRGVVVALHLANGALSVLLLVGALSLASGRSWARSVMVQALGASILYEVPATAYRIRWVYELMSAQRSMLAGMVHVRDLQATPDQVAFAWVMVLILAVVGVAVMGVLLITYYGVSLRYLRRRDVQAWFGQG